MDTKRRNDTPLSQTNVSLSLSLIQKQCAELLQLGDTQLTLVDQDELAAAASDSSCNPYDHGA